MPKRSGKNKQVEIDKNSKLKNQKHLPFFRKLIQAEAKNDYFFKLAFVTPLRGAQIVSRLIKSDDDINKATRIHLD